MRCSDFQELHCAFIDDTLAGVELVRMQTHRAECRECAERDTRVRRSLMAARSLPPIEPSADFTRKLEARLAACRAGADEPSCPHFRAVAAVGAIASIMMIAYVAQALQAHETRSLGSDIVVSPVVAMAPRQLAPQELHEERRSYARSHNTAVMHRAEQGGTMPPAELVAGTQSGMVPMGTMNDQAGTQRRRRQLPAPEIIASVSAGMPLWPAALFAEQGPMHFANTRRTVH
jgi:hypothetical protein